MANNDYGFQKLLNLLSLNPQLVRELTLDPTGIQALLNNRAAEKLAEGLDAPEVVDPTTFLRYMAGPQDGTPDTLCTPQTKYLCAKGTRFALASCGSGTQKLPTAEDLNKIHGGGSE